MLRLFLTLFLLIFTTSASANCESGSYLIHTVADYWKGDPEFVYLQFGRAGDYVGLFVPTSYSESVCVKTSASGERCIPISEALFEENSVRKIGEIELSKAEIRQRIAYQDDKDWQKEKEIIESFNKLEIDNRGGAIFFRTKRFADLPEKKWIKWFYKQEKITFPETFSITSSPADKKLVNEVEAEVQKLSLSLSDYEETEQAKPEIKPSSIEKVSVIETTGGNAGNDLHVIVANLQIKSTEKQREFLSEYQSEELKSSLRNNKEFRFNFPVIFLKQPSKPLTYFGDGRWCSSYVITSEIYKKQLESTAENMRELPSADRFNVTEMLDFDGDGGSDLFIINNAVAYELKKDGTVLVVSHPEGC